MTPTPATAASIRARLATSPPTLHCEPGWLAISDPEDQRDQFRYKVCDDHRKRGLVAAGGVPTAATCSSATRRAACPILPGEVVIGLRDRRTAGCSFHRGRVQPAKERIAAARITGQPKGIDWGVRHRQDPRHHRPAIPHDQMPMSLDQGPRGPLCRRVAARLRSSITSGGREISSRVPGCRPSARAGSLAAERLPGLPHARRQHHDFESLSKGKNGRLDRATRTVRTGSERPGSCCSRKCAGHTALRRRTAPFPARAGTPAGSGALAWCHHAA